MIDNLFDQPLDFLIETCELWFDLVDVPADLRDEINAIEGEGVEKISQMLCFFAQTCQVEFIIVFF